MLCSFLTARNFKDTLIFRLYYLFMKSNGRSGGWPSSGQAGQRRFYMLGTSEAKSITLITTKYLINLT